jgi:hypothetical protein
MKFSNQFAPANTPTITAGYDAKLAVQSYAAVRSAFAMYVVFRAPWQRFAIPQALAIVGTMDEACTVQDALIADAVQHIGDFPEGDYEVAAERLVTIMDWEQFQEAHPQSLISVAA